MLKYALLLLPLICFADNYSKLYPQYFEYCAGTQIDYQNGSMGGFGGHGFMYIEGMCAKADSEIPQVVPCSEAKSAGHTGVGISLDSDYKSYPWVAVPGRELILFGDMDRSKKVDEASMVALAKKAARMGIFRKLTVGEGIVDESLKPGSFEYETAIAKFSIGTNLAANWGRKLECIRIPIPEKGLDKVAKYLNDFNTKYYTADEDYQWALLNNNCTHLIFNAMAEIGLNKKIEIDSPWYTTNFYMSLAVPMNGLYLYQEIGNFGAYKLEDVEENKQVSSTLNTYGSIYTGVGAINATYPVYANNDVFNFESLGVVGIPRKSSFNPFNIYDNYQMRDKSYNDDEFRSLEVNLEYWKRKYEQEEEEMKSRFSKKPLPELNKIESNYLIYLSSQLEEVDRKLELLR